MKKINIREFADDTRDMCGTKYYEYYTAEAAERVLTETNLLELIGKGETVRLTVGDWHRDMITACNIPFARPIM